MHTQVPFCLPFTIIIPGPSSFGGLWAGETRVWGKVPEFLAKLYPMRASVSPPFPGPFGAGALRWPSCSL